jgi:putative ABC transport system substrate-binding protein
MHNLVIPGRRAAANPESITPGLWLLFSCPHPRWLCYASVARPSLEQQMRRRQFIALLGAAAAALPFAARAEPKMLRVGYSGMLPRGAPHYLAFERRMAELGYQEGRNFAFEFIQAPGIEGYELTYRELAARQVDIFLAAGNEPALRAAREAAGTRPIVFIAIDFDPVEKGLIASLSRPGSNMAGIFVSQLELAGKRIEILRDALPGARRVGLLWDASSRDQATAASPIAARLGFEPHPLEVVGEPPDYAAALLPLSGSPGEPVALPASPLFLRDRAIIARLLIERRTPSICAFREVMEAGALISYGVNLVDLFADVAALVDQVAKGAKAGDIPVGAPSHYHTAFNLKTASALGLDIAPTLLARADEVIE